jgi:hypothetical protein
LLPPRSHVFWSLPQYLGDLDPTALLRRENAGPHHGERSRRILTPDLMLALPAGRIRAGSTRAGPF